MASRNERARRNRSSRQARRLGSPATWRGGGEFGAGQFEQEYRHPHSWPPRTEDEDEPHREPDDDTRDRQRDDDEPPLGRSTAQGDAGLYELRAGLASHTRRAQRYGEQQRAPRDDDDDVRERDIEPDPHAERSSRRRSVRRETDRDRS